MGSPADWTRRTLTVVLLASLVVRPSYAQQDPPVADPPDEPAVEAVVPSSVLDPSKTDQLVELLTTAYAANLALETAVRTAGCTREEPACSPLFFAQDVILGPWNFVRLMRVLQELPATDVATVAHPRDYQTSILPPAGVLPARLVSLAEYAMEQQVALVEQLEAWQITLERYGTALAAQNETAAAAQQHALNEYSAKASTAAAAVSAASSEFLEQMTPFIRYFASAISLEEAEAAKIDLQENGFSPELQGRFGTLGIGKADSDNFRAEISAMSDAVPVDLLYGLTEVAKGYDALADLLTVAGDSPDNQRPTANAGPDQTVSADATEHASLVLNGSASTDPEAAVLTYVWTTASATALGSRPTITLPLGTHYIALTVDDGKGGTDVDIVAVTVADDAAPLITAVTATPDVLFPPNRQLVAVNVDVKVVDNDDPAPFCQVVSVAVDGPPSAAGGATEPDIVLAGNLTVLLRAEQSGAKRRGYTLTVQCTDKTNHSSLGSVFVSVPR